MEPARHRVVVYITRQREGTTELLVFAHRDYPEAGIQVPGGGVEKNETLNAAAVREAQEEAGVEVTLGEALGIQELPYLLTGKRRLTVFFHATTNETRSEWTHTVTSEGEDAGLVFECRFVPIDEADLLDGLDEWLHLVPTARSAVLEADPLARSPMSRSSFLTDARRRRACDATTQGWCHGTTSRSISPHAAVRNRPRRGTSVARPRRLRVPPQCGRRPPNPLG